jgi:hypothetical protein
MIFRHALPAARGAKGRRVWLVLACQLAALHLRAEKPSEFEVKAVYLFHFGKFVQWPAEARSRSEVFTICVLGDDPFGEILDRILAGETLDGKPPAIRRIRRAQAASDCRILFISDSEADRVEEILESLRDRSVLTVSDMDDFSRKGGMIELVLDQDRVRFEVNLEATAKARLELSSELLKVARAVKRGSSAVRRSPVRVAGATPPELARGRSRWQRGW